MKNIFFALFLISSIAQSQTSIKGTMNPVNKNYEWVILYQLKGAKQLYIANVTVVDGKFKVDFPENSAKGMYRITYDLKNNGFVDFIYNNETIEVEFDPGYPSGTVKILVSEENKIYNEYQNETNAIRQKLDSLQLAYFKTSDENQKNSSIELYGELYSSYNVSQKKFEDNSIEKLANHFIKSSYKYYAPAIIQTPQEYLNSEKKHYFDFINFNDDELRNSIFLSEKVIDYVFYLNQSDDLEVQYALYKNAVKEVMDKVGENNSLKSELSTILLYTFAQVQNTVLIDFLIDDIYKKLPNEYVDEAVIKDVQSKVKLAIGKTAPDFSWVEKGKSKKLSELNNAEKYILVFWSTTCSHCLAEVPQLYKLTKDNEKIHVIAFAMENDEFGFEHHTQSFTKWTNILGLEKWQNKTAKEYEITSTPTYFVLDANKKIIAKPEFFIDIKRFFENQK